MRVACGVVIALALAGSGCARKPDSSAGDSAGPSAPRLPTTPRFAYVANRADSTIGIYVMDPATRVPKPRGYVHVDQGAPMGLVVHNGFLYVAASVLVQYTIDPVTGDLTFRGTAQAGTDPSAVAAVRDLVLVANRTSNNVTVFTVNPANGALAASQTMPADAGPSAIKVDASGKAIFVTNATANNLCTYLVPASGPVGGCTVKTSTGPGPRAMATSLDNARPSPAVTTPDVLYVANNTDGTLSAFNIDPATMTLAPRDIDPQTFGVQNLQVGASPTALTTSADGQFVYVAHTGGIATVTSAAPNGSFSVAGQTPGAAISGDIAMTIAGDQLIETGTSQNEVLAFAVDRATGALTKTGASFGRGIPANIAMVAGTAPPASAPRVVLAGGGAANATTDVGLRSYQVNETTGALTERARVDGLRIEDLALHPRLSMAYGVGTDASNQGKLQRFQIGLTDGIVTAAGPAVPTGAQPSFVVVDPSGRFAYVIHMSANPVDMIWTFTLDANSGQPTRVPGVTLNQGNQPSGAAIDPLGRFLYVANSLSSNVAIYRIDSGTGALTPVNGTAMGSGVGRPTGVAVHPFMPVVYVSGANGTASFAVSNPTTGALSRIGAAGTPPNSVPVRIAHASGRHLLGSGPNNALIALALDAATGAAVQPAASAPGGGTNLTGVDMAADASGRFAFSLTVETGGVSKIVFFTTTNPQGTLTLTRGGELPAIPSPKAIVVRNVTQ